MIEHLRAMIILDINRRRSICSWFEYLGGSAAIFFCLLLPCIRLVSIEGDRRLEVSSAHHANVYLRSRRIHVWDIWRTYIGYAYVVYVWTWRIGWSVGVRYIDLISVFYNAVDIAYDYNSLTACLLYLIPYTQNTLRDMCDFGSHLTLACGLRFHLIRDM